MNENIKEIVNIIGNAEISNKCHSDCFINTDFDNECTLCRQATALYKQGYRKQSETVKEFAEKALALCCKHHYSIATRNNQRGMGMFTEGFEQVLSETAAELAEQYGKEETK